MAKQKKKTKSSATPPNTIIRGESDESLDETSDLSSDESNVFSEAQEMFLEGEDITLDKYVSYITYDCMFRI